MLRRPPEPPRGLDGLPVADPLEERVARVVAWIAALWFALAAAWELFGPLLAGHYASSASMGIIAENMLRWRIPGPVWEYTRTPPGPEMYYCHHPWGIFWTTAVLMKLFGRHDFVCRLAPVLLSAVTPPLLYQLGRAIWRPAAGAAAAAAFVVLPITLAFAGFNALEVPVIAWSLLGLWGFVRLTQTGRRRHLAAALAGSLLSLHADWPAFVLAGAMLGFGLARGVLVRDAFGPLRSERRYAAWWMLSASGAVLTLGLYVALFKQSGKLDDLLGSYAMRSSGNALPVAGAFGLRRFLTELARVLESRRYWIELSFSPIAIALGKAAAVLAALRLLVLRREHEFIPLGVLLMATVQYVVFKQGADIHVFWPQYFGAYFALAMGAIVATLAPALAWVGARVSPRVAPKAAVIALGVALLPVLAIARDGIPALRYARETGGRFNEKGLLIHSDGAKTAFLRFIDPGLPRAAPVEMHEGMKTTWSQVWTLGGRIVQPGRPAPTRARNGGAAYLADTRFMYSDVQGEIARQFHVTAVGPFWKVDEAAPNAPIDAFAIVEREPSWWEWYFISGTEPHREIVPDPYLTWELRTHFGQPAEAPAAKPATLEQRRIAHNIAVAAGDEARAAALLAEIMGELTAARAAFADGTEILGTTFHRGARSLLTIYVRAGGPTAGDVQLAVRSKVTAKARWSTTIADPTEREVGIPIGLSPQRWKKGFVYSDPVAIRKRPGTEVFRASWVMRGPGSPPKRVGSGGPSVEVLRLD
jgi:4-amino-4-deoxy-L-arabinose transferase-like glycosyltransferase